MAAARAAVTCPVAHPGDAGGMHIQTDRALVPAHAPSIRYLHVVISAPPAPAPPPGAEAAARPPAAAALVLDRSGSMAGSKLAMARAAVKQAVRLLRPSDELAVVCYDDRVDVVLGRTPAGEEAKTLALRRLAEIDARGSTNLGGGWLRGAGELRDASAAGVRRVLLLTDGLANRGETAPDALAAKAAELRGQGITTSTASAPGVLRVPLGDLVANQEVALVVAVGVRQAPAAGDTVSVQCRVADREQRLPALPMEVAWTAAEVAADQAQPVNADVLVEVARLLAEQARTMALTANRRGAYDEARRILADMAQTLRALLPGDARVAAIAARLHDEVGEYSLALDAMEVKRRHFASRMVAESRAVEGKARRRPPVVGSY